jgi:AcrR family transcriptional regulator
MGIVERRERIKKRVKADILSKAREIARNEGWSAVSIRKIAELIEYSPPIVYEYFENKDKLLETIRQEGFAHLKNEFTKVSKVYQNPEKQLIEVSKCIWQFSVDQYEVFQVMFNLEGAYCQSRQVYTDEMNIQGNPVWDMIAKLRPKSAEAVSKTYYEWWCFTYGFICLTITTQPRHAVHQAEPLYMEGVRRFIRSIM